MSPSPIHFFMPFYALITPLFIVSIMIVLERGTLAKIKAWIA